MILPLNHKFRERVFTGTALYSHAVSQVFPEQWRQMTRTSSRQRSPRSFSSTRRTSSSRSSWTSVTCTSSVSPWRRPTPGIACTPRVSTRTSVYRWVPAVFNRLPFRYAFNAFRDPKKIIFNLSSV